ncbi:MAG TPA: rhomboid family intramembrane serine protease [Pseudoxanthomonas sp.]|mgnify:CR=1 FL=1|nr:rhomboid family intramembrane serine protease [Pseudoxanthomonas sp.]
MFVSLPSRRKPSLRWATPLLLAALWLAFLWMLGRPDEARRSLWLAWGALARGLGGGDALLAALRDGSVLRLFTALFLHADWAHLLGNLVFLLIFGLPAERAMGPWRFLFLFLCGGAAANLAAVSTLGSPDRAVIGASGAVSAVIGAYLALFPGARLGVVLPLGLFLEFVRAPAFLLIGIWAALQVLFMYIGPAFGAVAWAAHVAGFLFGVAFALVVRAGIARRLRRQKGY